MLPLNRLCHKIVTTEDGGVILSKQESSQQQNRQLARSQATEKAAEVLLKIRRERNLSQAQLAELSGRKQSYISRVESKQQNVSLATLQEIVNAAGGDLLLDIQLNGLD